jgi:hypothetical protein
MNRPNWINRLLSAVLLAAFVLGLAACDTIAPLLGQATATVESKPTPALPPAKPVVSGTTIFIGETVFFELKRDMPKCDTFQYQEIPGGYGLIIGTCSSGADPVILLRTDGSLRRAVTASGDMVKSGNLVWSQDGHYLVYERDNEGKGAPLGLVRYTIGTGDRMLLIANVSNSPIMWADDNRWVAFVSWFTLGNPNLMLINVDGRGLWNLGKIGKTCVDPERVSFQWTADEAKRNMLFKCGTFKLSIPLGVSARLPGQAAPSIVSSYRLGNVPGGLKMYAQPDPASQVIADLPPTASGIQATGLSQKVGETVWAQVTWYGKTGYVDSSFLKE